MARRHPTGGGKLIAPESREDLSASVDLPRAPKESFAPKWSTSLLMDHFTTVNEMSFNSDLFFFPSSLRSVAAHALTR